MANSYQQFSFCLEVNRKQANWLSAEHAKLTDIVPCSLEVEASTKPGGLEVYFFEENCGDVDCTADLIQRFLIHFKIKRKVGFEWANTCDKPRPGEFGGGAVVISARKYEWMNTGTWLAKGLKA